MCRQPCSPFNFNMVSLSISFLLSLAFLAGTSLGLPDTNKRQVPTPNLTCGRALGEGINYFCPVDLPCCSNYGYCGAGDAYCNTLAGCQASHSNPTVPNCHMPIDKVTESPDGKCGRRFEETWGYRCPKGDRPCCSSL